MYRTIAIILLSAGFATGQVSVRFLSGQVSARAGSNSSVNTRGTVSASYSVPGGGTVSAQAVSTISANYASVSASASFTPGASIIGASARATLVVRLTSATPVAGTLQLGGSSGSRIDVGNDGSIEPLDAKIPIVIDSVGVEIAFLTSASVWMLSTSPSRNFAWVSFQSTTSRLLTSLPACGASLGARITPGAKYGTLNVTAESSVATNATFYVIGLTRQRIPIPPLGCELGTDLVIVAPVRIDPMRRASLSLHLPYGGGASVYMQFLVGEINRLGNQMWRTSNRLEIVL